MTIEISFDVEATPVLGAVEGIDLDEYKTTLIQRFGNSAIRDSVARICTETSSKLPVFLIPTIRENLDNGGSIKYATLVLAAWCNTATNMLIATEIRPS